MLINTFKIILTPIGNTGFVMKQMNSTIRRKYILEHLRQNEKLEYSELSTLLGVTAHTIRRDINELASEGSIIKLIGGAQAKSKVLSGISDNEKQLGESSKLIAFKAASIVQANQVVVFDDGKIPLMIAGFLPRDINLTIVAHSFAIASLTFEFPNIKLIFAGGTASKGSQITMGSDVVKKYNTIHADLSFLTVRNLHPDYGVTHPVLEEAEIKCRISEMSA